MPLAAHRWLMTAPGQPLERAEFDATPAAGEVAVQVAGCGVCHTDLGYYYDGVRTNQPLPLALGHEISGRVVAAGPGAEAWLGKRVTTRSAHSGHSTAARPFWSRKSSSDANHPSKPWPFAQRRFRTFIRQS